MPDVCVFIKGCTGDMMIIFIQHILHLVLCYECFTYIKLFNSQTRLMQVIL